MTYENRWPANYAFGTLSVAAAISDTTLQSVDFGSLLPSGLSTTLYVPMVLQDQSTKLYEIVWVNAHTAAATSCTVLRGREGTAARAWPSGTLWTISPTLRDGVLPVTTRSALPTDPHVGLRCEIQDEQVVVEWTPSVGWFSPLRPLAGRIVTTAGQINTAIAGTEIDIAKLAVTGRPTRNGGFYRFLVNLSAQFTVGGDAFTVRVRKDTAVTGTVVATWSWISRVSGLTEARSLTLPWKATADNASTSFFVSVQRAAGTGTCDINGQRLTSFEITDCTSDTTVWAEVA